MQQQPTTKNTGKLSVLEKPPDLVMFNFLLQLQTDFEAKHKKAPDFLLIHPNDAEMLNKEMRATFGKVIFGIKTIPSYLINESSPLFVTS